jgi:hypothetical protein
MRNLKEQAQHDLDSLLKLAAKAKVPWTPGMTEAWGNYMKAIAKPLILGLGTVGAAGLSSYYFTKKEKERHDEDIMSSLKTLAVKNPQFKKEPETFIERFGELSLISPTVAKNPSLAAKVLSKKMKSGFSVDDIHKLTSIESNSSSARRFNPGAAGRASAGHALSTITSAFGRDLVDYKKNLDKEFQDRMRAIEKSHEDLKNFEYKPRFDQEGNKLASSTLQRVSDECLGTMLAERYVLVKQAGLLSTTGSLIGAGAGTMAKGMALFAPAMALAGGAELVRQAIESHRNTALQAQADKNFAQIMKSNDKFQGDANKQLAMEAFETLKTVAPSLAARRLVAETFIDYTVGQGQLAPQTVQQLAEAEDKVRGIGSNKSNFVTDLKTTMGFMDSKKIHEVEKFHRTGSIGRRKR